MLYRLFEKLMPDLRARSAYSLPYDSFYEQGIRGLIFDIDNTLVMHGAPPGQACVELFDRLKKTGFSVLILSNNGIDRVKSFADTVGAAYLNNAGKPSKKGYLKGCRIMGIRPDEALAVGDQIFTDILGAKRCGIRAVMVEPIDPREEIQIRLKRLAEKPVLALYAARSASGRDHYGRKH